jgi:hypothetical protein
LFVSWHQQNWLTEYLQTLLDYMAAQAPEQIAATRVLACLNTLFPAFLPLEDDQDIDPDPCTTGLRESIRLTVFDSLREEPWLVPEKQAGVRIRLLGWCGVPQYQKACAALLRYVELTRKLEEILADAFTEHDEPEDITPVSPTGELFNTSVGEQSALSDRTVLSRMSSPYSSSSSSDLRTGMSLEASVCTETHPLFTGMPGRELSAFKTDGAAFSRDFDNPPVRSPSDEMDRAHWTQHPLAKSLALSSKEKALLGLILPTEIPNGEF